MRVYEIQLAKRTRAYYSFQVLQTRLHISNKFFSFVCFPCFQFVCTMCGVHLKYVQLKSFIEKNHLNLSIMYSKYCCASRLMMRSRPIHSTDSIFCILRFLSSVLWCSLSRVLQTSSSLIYHYHNYNNAYHKYKSENKRNPATERHNNNDN